MLHFTKKILVCLCLASLTFVSACRDRIITTENGKTKEGNEYRIFRRGDNSRKIVDGDIISFHVVVKSGNDSLMGNTYAQGQRPIEMQVMEKEMPKAILKMIKMLTVEDSAVFRIKTEIEVAENKANMKKGLGQMREQVKSLPDSIRPQKEKQMEELIKAEEEKITNPKVYPAGKFITYQIKVLKVRSEEDIKREQKESEQKMEKDQKESRAKEKVELEAYIKKNNLKTTTTESGLQYILTQEGQGTKPKKGDKVKVNYVGKLLNGKVFDTSIESIAKTANLNQAGRKYEPIEISIGLGQVIPGWDEGIMLLNKGSKATFIIPNKLAYGMNSPSPDIPAGAPLIFDVELVEVSK